MKLVMYLLGGTLSIIGGSVIIIGLLTDPKLIPWKESLETLFVGIFFFYIGDLFTPISKY